MNEQRQRIKAADVFMLVMSTFGLAVIALVLAPIWTAVIWGF